MELKNRRRHGGLVRGRAAGVSAPERVAIRDARPWSPGPHRLIASRGDEHDRVVVRQLVVGKDCTGARSDRMTSLPPVRRAHLSMCSVASLAASSGSSRAPRAEGVAAPAAPYRERSWIRHPIPSHRPTHHRAIDGRSSECSNHGKRSTGFRESRPDCAPHSDRLARTWRHSAVHRRMQSATKRLRRSEPGRLSSRDRDVVGCVPPHLRRLGR